MSITSARFLPDLDHEQIPELEASLMISLQATQAGFLFLMKRQVP
jgi:hypothetical protein